MIFKDCTKKEELSLLFFWPDFCIFAFRQSLGSTGLDRMGTVV